MAMVVASTNLPPRDLTSCIGIICNGEIEISSHLEMRINKCRTIIGVDGGLNHCKAMNITPNFIVGDFDSAKADCVEEFSRNAGVTILPRAKDCTDLESAIEKAKEVYQSAQMVIWGGLGGRIDHTLGNIFLLFRNQGSLFIESEEQTVFAISDTMGKIKIDHPACQTLTLFPLNGAVQNVHINHLGERIELAFIDKNKPYSLRFHEECTVTLGKGEILAILDKRKVPQLGELPQGDVRTSFALGQPLAHIFGYLVHQSISVPRVNLFSDRERVFNIQSCLGKLVLGSQRGLTISLVPFGGPVTGIKTEGLKWELGEETLTTLDKHFVGISNVAMGDSYSLSVGDGELLCIVNEGLIDEELVEAII